MVQTSRILQLFKLFLPFALFNPIACVEMPKTTDPVLHSQSATESYADKDKFIRDGYYETIPKMPQKGYKVKKLKDDVYFFTTGIYNNLFILGSEGVLITDPIEGAGLLLKKAVAEVTGKPIQFMVYTHSHIDHIGDAHFFNNNVQIIAHKATLKQLNRYKDPNRPPPHIAFDRNYSINFGGPRVDLIFVSEGHDMGNLMVHVPERKVLMLVDVATPKAVPFKNFSTVDLYGQILLIKRALKLDWDMYVAGHLYRPGKRKEMKEVLNYYYSSKSANAQALKNVKFADVMAQTKSKDMEQVFGEYYDAVAEHCYQILKKTWEGRLMGFATFVRGHCDAWTAFHRTHKRPGK